MPPSEIHLSEIIRLIDGPLAPFGDAEQLRSLIDRDAEHRALYQVFLDVRDAAAKILENTTLADILNGKGADPRSPRKRRKKKGGDSSVLPMVVHGNAEPRAKMIKRTIILANLVILFLYAQGFGQTFDPRRAHSPTSLTRKPW